MDTFLLFGLIGFGCLILGILGYTTMTNKIIKEQERKIAALTTENKRLKSALRGAKYVNKIVLSDKPLDYPPTAKIKLSARDSLKEY
jgi:hypothetical protein